MLVLKDIPGFSKYKAGSDGKIYSFCYGDQRALSTNKRNKQGYIQVTLSDDFGKFVAKSAAPIICESFHGSRPSGLVCSHLNGNKIDNRPENLLWETQKENLKRKKAHGTHDGGCNNTRAKLDKEKLAYIKHMLREGVSYINIAKDLGVSRTLISLVASGRSYVDDFNNERIII